MYLGIGPEDTVAKKATTAKAAEISKKAKPATAPPAVHTEDLVRLKRIRGQIEGVERMIEDKRYCMDIVNQIRSAMAALRSVEGLVMERHIRHCVSSAIDARDEGETEAKINELLTLFHKR